MIERQIKSGDFGQDFIWGAASSAFQTEGSPYSDGRGHSIWDHFSFLPGKIRNGDHAELASDFYTRFPADLDMLRSMHFGSFRFSLSWSRILPFGRGKKNSKGIDFYNLLIDTCLEKNIVPWVTLYHWDLPLSLENAGGWTNRDIVSWFQEFASIAASHFGDRVKHWMVLNEPSSFTSLGYLLGMHAPGRRGLRNFLPAVHYATLCQSLGARTIRQVVPRATIGTCYSFSVVDPLDEKIRNRVAAKKLDAVINRLFIEPALGLGYPTEDLPVLSGIEKFMEPDDRELQAFNFDFVGVQYYFRMVAAHSILPPYFVKEIPALKRKVPVSSMRYEIYPEGIYSVLKRLNNYPNIHNIIVTENGV
jgi:beta-glucosidase